MHKHLFFICPTDHLEPVINNMFRQEHYYLTSLGNSITFDSENVAEITRLLEERHITEITFALADNNKIVLDAIYDYQFARVSGLDKFYNEIFKQRKRLGKLWQLSDSPVPILACYLNQKIKELQLILSEGVVNKIKVNARIYNTRKNIFQDQPHDLFVEEYYNLN